VEGKRLAGGGAVLGKIFSLLMVYQSFFFLMFYRPEAM
jgi:hypothetical protein